MISRLAYVMAWRNAKNAGHHSDAVRLTATLAERLDLPVDSPLRQALETFLDAELAANPGRFSPTEESEKVLAQLLREDVGGFQRTLSPILSEASYERFQDLLDSLKIRAR